MAHPDQDHPALVAGAGRWRRLFRPGLLLWLGLALCAGALAAAPLAAAHEAGRHEASRELDQVPRTSEAVARGSAVFQRHCATCHMPDSTRTKVGPGLKGLFALERTPVLHHPVSVAVIREHIRRGSRNMPAFKKLSNGQMDALLAYLQSL